MFAPMDTPDDVVAGLEAAMKEITESEAFINAMAERGNAPVLPAGTRGRGKPALNEGQRVLDHRRTEKSGLSHVVAHI